MTTEHRGNSLPPAQPSYIFRGHSAHIHSVQIVRQNTRLLTGDADGWIVYWKLESKRPVAVWKAHDAAILGTAEWGFDKIITHGRDHALRIWQLRATDEPNLSSLLPADGSSAHRPKPWLLHSLPVNTLNFCKFAMCRKQPAINIPSRGSNDQDKESASMPGASESILVAVPARDDKKIEVYQFPEERMASVVPRVQPQDTGMLMTLKLTHHHSAGEAMVIAGYEGGFTAVHLLGLNNSRSRSKGNGPTFAQTIYLSQPHSQPVLSLDASLDAKMYFTSSADAIIAAHRIPEGPLNIDEEEPEGSIDDPPESDLSALTVGEPPLQNYYPSRPSMNADNHDSSPSSDPEKTDPQHTEQISEPLTFSKRPVKPSSSPSPSLPISSQNGSMSTPTLSSAPKSGGLSSLLSSAPPLPKTRPPPPKIWTLALQPPFKTISTKHAGQQSLCVRADGRILATGGWDSRIRIYSAKTLKELAVLKWHKEGVYAVGFGEVYDKVPVAVSLQDDKEIEFKDGDGGDGGGGDGGGGAEVARQRGMVSGLGKMQRQREEQMQMKHWVVAGAKDGKVSLWEVY
ncbi:WD40-repeat-containing domain protein [Clohesyomyces aquaticus]|uniref:ASTRA-associated protein 1 n=1 Tax=Clohesyomyces aquaticus TaxID=1231657 RepID=A0A1Y2A3A5_9PLEO|nr:WD40-repeat-containing domain protein [Clohesyomyces aquaticus]